MGKLKKISNKIRKEAARVVCRLIRPEIDKIEESIKLELTRLEESVRSGFTRFEESTRSELTRIEGLVEDKFKEQSCIFNESLAENYKTNIEAVEKLERVISCHMTLVKPHKNTATEASTILGSENPSDIALCRICKTELSPFFDAKMLEKYDIRYFHCPNCGFLQTEDPYWLQESYASSINVSDTGIMWRNNYLANIASIIIYHLFGNNAKFLDFAGGHGFFTRLMRDIGFDFYWHDPYSENLVARGFEYNDCFDIELITTFESFEHFVDPISEIEKMLRISKNILFTTDILPDPAPKPEEWWYYGLEHGQHISFFSKKTFEFIAAKYNLNFYSFNNIHLLTVRTIGDNEFEGLVDQACQNDELFKSVKTNMKSKTLDDMHTVIAALKSLK